MRRRILLSSTVAALFLTLSLFVLSSRNVAAQPMAFPGKDWQKATPESQGVDSRKLTAALDYLAKNSGRDGIKETVIIRNGYMIWKGSDIDKVHGVWSATKSFTTSI